VSWYGRAVTVEGVTKFSTTHARAPLSSLERDVARSLCGWRAVLFRLGLVGRDPQRYGGAAYGNVSARVGPFPGERGARAFVVSGTQTGDLPEVDVDHFCTVTRYELRRNHVVSHGPIAPSSESMTHGAVYDVSPTVRAVLHVHAPMIFRAAAALSLPCTAAGIDYGTPEMAWEVARLWRSTALPEVGVFAMTAHEDGIIAFGRSLDEAGARLIRALARALST
jgi:ribulose-5-phosphate 4-epimerase/fuculose-1-phosphate aldolase